MKPPDTHAVEFIQPNCPKCGSSLPVPGEHGRPPNTDAFAVTCISCEWTGQAICWRSLAPEGRKR